MRRRVPLLTLLLASGIALAAAGVADPKEPWQPKKGDTVYANITFVGARDPSSGESRVLLPCAPLKFRGVHMQRRPATYDPKTGATTPPNRERTWLMTDLSGWGRTVSDGLIPRVFRTEAECREAEQRENESVAPSSTDADD